MDLLQLQRLFKRSPALMVALALLSLRGSIDLFPHPLSILLAFFPLLFVMMALTARLFLPLLLFFSAACFWPASPPISVPEGGIAGELIFQPMQLTKLSSGFGGQRFLYRGKIIKWRGQEMLPLPLEASFIWKRGEKSRPLAASDLSFTGTLKLSPKGHLFLIPAKNSVISPLGHFRLAEMRFQWQQKLEKMIVEGTKDKEIGAYLTALLTGNFDLPLISYELSRLGLKHVAVVSGFHFSLIASFLSFGLRLLFQRRLSALILCTLLTFYLLFVGQSPSLLRAYCTAFFFWNQFTVERRALNLNLLGLSLLFVLFLDPFAYQKLAFQFSFLATYSLIAYQPLYEKKLQFLLPERTVQEGEALSFSEKHIYLILTFLRQAFSASLAVHLGLIPLLLYFFQQFPLIGLFLNLFYPVAIGASLALLLLALSFYFLPPIASILLQIDALWTRLSLDLIASIPKKMEGVIRYPDLSLSFLILYSVLFILFGLYLNQREEIS